MAGPYLTRFSPAEFPQDSAWPDSIEKDQAAVEQARRELGEDADPHDILVRARQIREEENF